MVSKKKKTVKSREFVKPNSFPKLWYILWEDHISPKNGSWVEWTDIDKFSKGIIQTVGWAFKETDEYLVIVPHFDSDGEHTIGAFIVLKKNILRRVLFTDPHKWE